ncbi:2-succinyl-6-hydroxy-2,4-cyclohexadiene-1-carboxylate synthase [Staphylococcus pettenkoferi]|uniref:2-succinyl-6-hydroxy-2, 4-cyclohexadiene-1-carboxylate synthase n=1 Tax=Staphylococcus pettenkoferi TaxID=170573 RepID=UPI0011AA520F|nr:2-succinyl-6-hydroxy-2,4-cyclohexadiene-1-carboxylate synthase [Staphylococcus pettenkoferi]MCY1568549.1 2-succinyl-6-hydroxy-2,4-cyclohexadiene-1-carboxylate synthase [Staphylococcus pettenkoferi]MCY1575591.1 2-succinyl-6-hydroxy-2,4-cyclohexadiene-1-carboxylate synthase [Staphylococcus pettenkoferi]MCY1618001.1 2-succinyl-6-hydroxy-2,4-cyclohexadiene-1-carboxylate synthase [Staphylococcus pettenkoferi]
MLNYNFYPAEKQSEQLLIMLHGFISDQRTYHQHLDTLRQQTNVLLLDLPGHGEDQSSETETWDFPFICSALDEVLKQFAEYQLYLQGYSMGGRVALYYAIYGTMKLSGLILESTSPGIEDEEQRIERQRVDDARAKVLNLAGIEVFVNDWEKLPLFQTQKQLPKEMQRGVRELRRSQAPNRLAKALRDYGTGSMPNLWPKLEQITTPTCIIVGDLDRKFCRIAERLQPALTSATKYVVEDVGHTVNVENITEFDNIVLRFMNEEDKHV